jgi:hypothetical protein
MNSCIIFLWIVFVLLHNDIVQAQSTIVAAGGNAIGPTAQVSYTIGQVVYTSQYNSDAIVDQGVQHSIEIYPVSIGKEEAECSLSVFPNPTCEFITISLGIAVRYRGEWSIIDIHGKQVLSQEYDSPSMTISLTDLPSGSYTLLIRDAISNKQQFYTVKKVQ